MKEARNKRVSTAWFHFSRLGDKHNLPKLKSSKLEVASTQWERCVGKEQGLFLGRSKYSISWLGIGYMDVIIYQDSLNRTFRMCTCALHCT